MKVAAVIAEYNPFHNGHRYQLEELRNGLGADYILVIMSGDFTQRGIPAIMDKYTRCQMALENGADCVFELPAYFSLGSAEYFAMGAVSLCDKLGVADILHFGSECGDIRLLALCADALAEETDTYKTSLQNALKEGNSFPTARAMAIRDAIPAASQDGLLSNPNNILGIEYIKALRQRRSPIKPYTARRTDNGYNSAVLGDGPFASANAIRRLLQAAQHENTAQLQALRDFVPESVYSRFLQDMGHFLFPDDFSQLMRCKLWNELLLSPDKLPCYYDVTPQLANTFRKNMNGFGTLTNFTLACKSKNLTYTRISRCLMHILLELTQDTADELKASDYCPYARLLGFREKGGKLLRHIKNNASIPVITKLPRALRELNGASLDSLKADIYASTIYQSVKSPSLPIPCELTRGLVKVRA